MTQVWSCLLLKLGAKLLHCVVYQSSVCYIACLELICCQLRDNIPLHMGGLALRMGLLIKEIEHRIQSSQCES
jgi:hypothetical protein